MIWSPKETSPWEVSVCTRAKVSDILLIRQGTLPDPTSGQGAPNGLVQRADHPSLDSGSLPGVASQREKTSQGDTEDE